MAASYELCIAALQDGRNQERILQAVQSTTLHWSINQDLATFYVVAATLAQCGTGSFPRIVSGFRSPERQRQLIAKWDSGERGGLITKPSRRSWHMQHRAIDVQTDGPGFKIFQHWMEVFGVEWGGRWRKPDPVHFQWTRGGKQEDIDKLQPWGNR